MVSLLRSKSLTLRQFKSTKGLCDLHCVHARAGHSSGILFICAFVLAFENRIPTERNKIKHKTPSTHCGPIFSLRAGSLVWVVYHGQRQQGTENRRTLAPFFSPAPLPAIPYLKIPYPNKWACSQANLFLKCAIIAFLWFVKKPWLCKNKKQKH